MVFVSPASQPVGEVSDVNIRQQLIRDEGKHNKPYLDNDGNLTIGIGRNLDDRGISNAEAFFLFENDLRWVKGELIQRVPWFEQIDVVRQSVLINMAFNMGVPRLLAKNPKMLAAMKAKNWPLAAAELLNGPYKFQVGPRAYRLADQIEKGEWR